MCIAGGEIKELEKQRSAGWKHSHDLNMHASQFKAHQHLYFEGDPRSHVYFVEEGWVKLYRTFLDGQRQIVGFANAGSILGVESVDEHCNSCETITDARIRVVPVAQLSALFLSDPILADQILRQVGQQLGAAQAQLGAVGTQSAEQKIATFLLSIAKLAKVGPSGEFDLPMRRGDMAEFLGLRLETVSRKISDFQKKGWIRLASLYHCQILAPHILEELADGGNARDAEGAYAFV